MGGGFFESVYQALMLIPRGKVVTYGQIARAIGAPRMARQVGYALHANPKPGIIPCHRVVNREGKLAGAFAFGVLNAMKKLLEEVGVEVVNGAVDLSKFGYTFPEK